MGAHAEAVSRSCEWVIMGLESKAVSAQVTKLIVSISSKTCNNTI